MDLSQRPVASTLLPKALRKVAGTVGRCRAWSPAAAPNSADASERRIEQKQPVVGGHRHIGQGTQPPALGQGADPVGVPHPHGGVDAAQVGIKGGVAGGGVLAAVAERAIEQQQAFWGQHGGGAGHQVRHGARRHDVGRVGREHRPIGPGGPGAGAHVQGDRIGQLTAGRQLGAALELDALQQVKALLGPLAGLPVQLADLAGQVDGMLAAARADLEHPGRPWQPPGQLSGDRLFVALAGFRKQHRLAATGRSTRSGLIQALAQFGAEASGGCSHRLAGGVSFGHRLDQGAADDGAIGTPVAHAAGLFGGGDAEAHGHRRAPLGLELLHQGAHPLLKRGAHPGHPGDADQVGEAAAGGVDAGHALGRGGGGHQQHQVEAVAGGNRRELLALFEGQVGHHQAGRTGGGGFKAEGLHAFVEQGVAVGEQHHRDRQPALEAAEHGQHPGGGGVGCQGAAGRRLDHRAIGQGVAVGDAQLDQVGAAGLKGQQGGGGALQIGITCHQKGHQGAALLLPQGLKTLLDRRHACCSDACEPMGSLGPGSLAEPVSASNLACSSGLSASKRLSSSASV